MPKLPITDPNGKIIGYKEQKESQMRTSKKAVATKAPKAKAHTNGSAPTASKKAFKATIMAVNDDHVYAKANEMETDEESQIKAALDRWFKSGGIGQFNVYRRK